MSIYQHFRPEEREFIDQALHWKDYVESTYSAKLTDFLDPREQHIVKTIVGENGNVKLAFFGGTEKTERKRAYLFPEYDEAMTDQFQISLFEINYPSKFVTIEHPQVLGSLMSIGLKRGKFGDILFNGDRIQIFTASEVSDFLGMQLESIGRSKVELNEIPLSDAIETKEELHELSTTVSSLRLDTVIAAIHNLSRQKAQLHIGQGLVKVNWTVIENTAFVCEEGDIISMRGYGRAKIISIDGKTKKDKWRITAGKYQ